MPENWQDKKKAADDERKRFIRGLRYSKSHELAEKIGSLRESLSTDDLLWVIWTREQDARNRGYASGMLAEITRRRGARLRLFKRWTRLHFRIVIKFICRCARIIQGVQ